MGVSGECLILELYVSCFFFVGVVGMSFWVLAHLDLIFFISLTISSVLLVQKKTHTKT